MKPSHLALAIFATVAGLSSIARTQGISAGVPKLQQQLQQQVQQLKQENADLQAQLAEAQALASSKAGVVQAREILAKYRAGSEAANAQALQTAEERDRAIASLGAMRGVLAACQEKNNRLFDVSREILKAYDNTGFLDAMFEREPVIGIKRVELENIAQDRSDRIDEGRFTMPTDATTVQSSASKP